MDLSALKMKQIVGIVSFEGKFDINLAYIPRDEMRKILDKCKRTVFVKHQPTEEVDSEKLVVSLAKCIVGWEGLTVGVVATMIPIEVPEGQEAEEVPCTEENKLVLLRRAYGFEIFVQTAATDLSALKQEAERKN
ncbi:MAG: hypothetical protein HW415_1427 [Deltaproteobacteria bacterium]|nr:hypothetical protein [Deltaproteobacteria bacterium]